MSVVLAVIVLAATACFDPLQRAGDRDPNPDHITVGSGGVIEAQIIGQIYIDVLKANGFSVTDQLGSGTRERYIPALRAGDIDLVPDYIGNLLQYLAQSDPALPADDADSFSALTSLTQIQAALPRVLGADLAVLTASPGSNSDSVTVTQSTARQWNLRSIADLAAVARTRPVTLMANSEFATRSVGLPGLEKNYGLRVRFRPNNDSGGQATINELTAGRVTAADIYTTTPAITNDHLVVLDDPKHNFPANNIVPVVASAKNSPKLRRVLDAVSAALTVEQLRSLNDMVSGTQKLEVEDAAGRWIARMGLNRRLA